MSRATGLFVTGTDTGVGKTLVTAMLAVALRHRGLRVGVMKPVETGCLIEEGDAHDEAVGTELAPINANNRAQEAGHENDDRKGREGTSPSSTQRYADMGRSTSTHRCSETDGFTPSAPLRCPFPMSHADPTPMLALDSHFLRQISGCTAPPEVVTPYMFREPLAPAIAAQHEGQEIDLDHIVRCYKRLAAEHDIVLVEGAGGLLVPLTKQESFLDLAARLDLPILVVARNILGTINHTALTVTVASQRCRVIGIVLNTLTAELQDASQASNAEALQIWGRAPLLGVIPHVPEITPEGLLKLCRGAGLSPPIFDLSAILG